MKKIKQIKPRRNNNNQEDAIETKEIKKTKNKGKP